VYENQTFWQDVRSRLSAVWSDNVVNISLEKQEEVIYRPVREWLLAARKTAGQLWESPGATLSSFVEVLMNPRSWLSLRGGGVLLALLATAWVVHRVVRAIRRHWHRQGLLPDELRYRRQIEFYERFTRLMQALNLQREPAQTQREFACQATAALATLLGAANLTCGPGEISDLFYKVRFGNQNLPDSECRRAEALLAGMERALSPPVVDE
jgi:hypothetical protein